MLKEYFLYLMGDEPETDESFVDSFLYKNGIKTIDFTPSISISDAKAGPVISLRTKIVAVQSGSGDPTPENICPIDGWMGANIHVNSDVIVDSWQSEAGIVYGGVRNLTTGTLTVTHATKTYKGTSGEAWNYSERDGNRRVFIVLDGAMPSATDFWSNIASGGADSSYPEPWKMRSNANVRPSLIIGVDNTIGSANDWKALLADTNMIVVYPLAEPITYTLTPTEINLLAGSNTISSNTGDVALVYRTE